MALHRFHTSPGAYTFGDAHGSGLRNIGRLFTEQRREKEDEEHPALEGRGPRRPRRPRKQR